jgi:hypothetical protein
MDRQLEKGGGSTCGGVTRSFQIPVYAISGPSPTIEGSPRKKVRGVSSEGFRGLTSRTEQACMVDVIREDG